MLLTLAFKKYAEQMKERCALLAPPQPSGDAAQFGSMLETENKVDIEMERENMQFFRH